MLELFCLKEAPGPSHLLIHGFGGSSSVWNSLVDRIEGRVFAVDLPGHATSIEDKTAGSAMRMAEAIADTLDAFETGAFTITGYSMGGAVASVLAIQRPDLVESLLLLAPGGFGSDINRALLMDFAAAENQRTLAEVLTKMATPSLEIDAAQLEESIAMRKRPGQMAMLKKIADRVTQNREQGIIARDLLETIFCPTRIIWGKIDPVLSAEHIFHAPEHFEPLLLEGVGHMLIEEVPEMVASHINDMGALTADA